MFNLYTRKRFRTLVAIATAFLVLPSCQKTDLVAPPTNPSDNMLSAKNAKRDADVAVDWMTALRAVVKSEGKNPPQASRIFAYDAIALWEAVMPGMPGHKTLENQVPGLVNLPKKYKKDK